jgi:Na+-translocating ferredoxin:NAD+ oxidoreductase RnfD subunit
MISDPKTTPDARAGRIAFAGIVAFGAWYIQFRLFRTNGLLWSLAACSVFVPLIDLLLRAPRYSWTKQPSHSVTQQPEGGLSCPDATLLPLPSLSR